MNKPIKQSISFFASSLLIIALLVFVFLISSFWEYKRFIRHEIEHNFNQAEIKAEMTEQWVSEKYQQFTLLSKAFSLVGEYYKQVKLIQEFEEINKDVYKKLYYVDMNYNTIHSNGRGRVSESEFKPIFEQVSKKDSSLLTRAEFYPETNEPVFSIIVPIRNNNTVKGLLISVISLNSLSERIKTDSFEMDYHAKESTWVLDSGNRTLIQCTENLIFDFNLLQEENPAYRNIAQMKSHILNNSSGKIRYQVKNQEDVFFSFVKTQISDGWVIMVARLETNFWDYLSHNWMIKILLLLFCGSVIIFWFEYMSFRTLQPYQDLKAALVSFSSGNRYFKVDTKHSAESLELHDQVKALVDKNIEQSYNVEKLIRERTKALSDLNTRITSRNKELNEINAALFENNSHLKHKATTDMLTQLYNRQEFIDFSDKMIRDVLNGSEEGFSILFLDLDNFKQYNDNFSHDIGDFVLKNISALIQNNVRNVDVTGRYGGDEFVILIRHPDLSVAIASADRILSKIKEVNGFADEISRLLQKPVYIFQEDQLSCSIGVVHYDKDLGIDNAEDLLGLADDMMYQAKKTGKGKMVIYENQ